MGCGLGEHVPEISRFFGIVIAMYFSDHPPPHFHARYGKEKALVSIDRLGLIRGHLSPRVLGLVVEWAAEHQEELRGELAKSAPSGTPETDPTVGVDGTC